MTMCEINSIHSNNNFKKVTNYARVSILLNPKINYQKKNKNIISLLNPN